MSCLDQDIMCEPGKFATSVYHKPTFTKICTHFHSLCSQFSQVTKCFFQKNSNPENFINKCFEMFSITKIELKKK